MTQPPPTSPPQSPPAADESSSWETCRRVESWAGEVRVNLIRIAALVLFYGKHLIEAAVAPPDAPVRGAYHLRVTAVVVVWAAMAAVVHLLLSRRYYPPAMKFVTSLADVFVITILCAIAGGPNTPLLLLYFAVIAAAPLRLSLPLVSVTTAAAIAGYLVLLAYYAWYVVGFHTYYATPELRIPRGNEAIVILCLAVTGVFAGQVVRQSRRMIEQGSLISIAPSSPATGEA